MFVMFRRKIFIARFVLLAIAASGPISALACPFCSATQQTLSEEFDSADVVLLAKPKKVVNGSSLNDRSDSAALTAKTTFVVEEVLKGKDHVPDVREVQTTFFGKINPNATFLVTGLGTPSLDWTIPLQLTPDAVDYLKQLPRLPKNGKERLTFFQNYFEHKDPMLAQDSYEEFARAPYADVTDLRDHLKHDLLISWIKNPDVAATRRRLYLTLLSVCGDDRDLPMLETMIRSSDRQQKMGLDAMISCYLTLKGADGVPLIETLYLKNPEAEYRDTYAAVMALRFHGQESTHIPRERLLEAMRHLLAHPELADQIIPDLARWQDWSVMDRLVNLFKQSDEKSRWVRVPVVNYLRECAKQPGLVGQRAQKALEELATLDPETIERANAFFAFGILGGEAATADEKTKPNGSPQNPNKQTKEQAKPTHTQKRSSDKVDPQKPPLNPHSSESRPPQQIIEVAILAQSDQSPVASGPLTTILASSF